MAITPSELLDGNDFLEHSGLEQQFKQPLFFHPSYVLSLWSTYGVSI